MLSGLMLAAVLAFLLPPLLARKSGSGIGCKQLNIALYREQLSELERDLASGTLSHDLFEQSKAELEQRMLVDASAATPGQHSAARRNVVLAGGLGLAIPAIAVGLYLKLGSPAVMDTPAPVAPPVMEAQHAGQMEDMVGRLAERLKNTPDDAKGWTLLGRSYVEMQQYPEAVTAFQHAALLIKNDAALLADYADALAVAQGNSLQGEPEKLIQQALSVDPDNNKALALAGTVAFNRRDYKAAAQHWEKRLALLPAGSESAQEIAASIAEAKALSGDKSAVTQLPPAKIELDRIQAAASAGGMVSGNVFVAPALAARLKPDDTLFVFARAANGPKMPLAIINAKASSLPMKFTLSDDMAMTPTMKLSSFERVQIVARISKSGGAAPQSGDFEGISAPITVGTSGLRVVIDRALP